MTVSDELKNKELAKQHANPGPKATPTSIPPALMAWWIPILVGTLLFSLSLTISMFWRDSDKLVQLLHRSAVSCLTVLVLTLIVITVHALLKQKGIRQQEPLLCRILRTSLSSIFLYASTLIIGTIVACGFYTAVKNGAHWPSKDAMILCITTSGAGSLFSTWQQRSYENQIRAEQEEQKRLQYHRDTTRDEHWRRREKAYQLLADPSPNMRLIAASLLIELADSTLAAVESANSTFDTALLQQNIIDILCTQIRHEGYNLESEGTKEEHAHVQSTIVNKLLMWLSKREAGAPHSTQASRTINLSRVTFLPPPCN